MDQLVSVIINNYNYARFLRASIDSALNQTYGRTEVIVVDDGSTDASRDLIAACGQRVKPVLKDNGGQGSAFNAGFRASRGDVVIFLDADDLLFPTAAAHAVERFAGAPVVKVHWPLRVVDEGGAETGRVIYQNLPEGDLREAVRARGPYSCASPPTSGNAWSRWLLERILPMPEQPYRLCADDYLFALAPALGPVGRLTDAQSAYRVHGSNGYWAKPFEEKLELGLRAHERQLHALAERFRADGVAVDLDAWRNHSWFHRLRLCVAEIARHVPQGESFVLIDGDEWGTGPLVEGRRRIPFTEHDGQYWGPPAADATAVAELRRLQRAGAEFVAVGWTAFWWLEHYAALRAYLLSEFRTLVADDHLRLFGPKQPGGAT